jgi:peptidoglycan hydrolase-like protein with peptidoglycan-binding domain
MAGTFFPVIFAARNFLMDIFKGPVGLVLVAGLATSSALGATGQKSSHKHGKHAAAKVTKLHGQQTIAPERATEIQTALIREHYLTGEPTGKWDAETQAAMTKYQADQGWQTKIAPDSRALIKLGLGPNHANALNATSESHFNTLSAPGATEEQPQGLVAASGISH